VRSESLLESLTNPAQRGTLRISGSLGVSTAVAASILAQWSLASESPLLVVCPDDEICNSLASEIEALARARQGAAPAVHHVPTWERSPYGPITPSIRIRLGRVAALHVISEVRRSGGRKPSPIFLMTWAASIQATAPQESFRGASLDVVEGASIGSRDTFAARLAASGYGRVDPVEDPGTFAVRGEIIDVFPPGRENPVRIELFDDVIEKIREFDSGTQRTSAITRVPSLRIPPAREVLINAATSPFLREQVKARADAAGVSRKLRDPVLESISAGNYSELSDAWAPFAYERTATVWEHVAPEWPVVWVDEFFADERWTSELSDHIKLEASAVGAGRILPSVSELYRSQSDVDHGRSKLFLDRIEITGATSFHAAAAQGLREALTVEKPPTEADALRARLKEGFTAIAYAQTRSQLERMRFILEERGVFCTIDASPSPGQLVLHVGDVAAGFEWAEEGLILLAEEDLLGARKKGEKRRVQKRSAIAAGGSRAKDWAGLQALGDLQIGDAVVHIDHGIGRYRGLARLNLLGGASDFLQLEYANNDRLYLPIYRLDLVQKYSGSGDSANLDRLGNSQFAKAKERVRGDVKKLAIDLIKLYAERKVRPGLRFGGRDSEFREFEAKFPFEETPDQLKAIDDTLSDLGSGQAMDRLICGDVGYGKTEVAIRAAFRAVSEGKQVAVLVPTTLLAFQHEQSFRSRMRDYPLMIESLSRFKSSKEQKVVLESLTAGKVDIIIGTHRLLSRDVAFRDLGLVIVDEEHRFGVEHKEKLKVLKTNAHVLTLTATPIPRTLHMALSGLRDISLINTPPADRLPIRTFISKQDDDLIARAISFELERGGQVFFVHNRVQDIFEVANKIRALAPQAKIAVGHGQMGEGELEESMLAFYEKRANVLVCTSIIESGLDVPSANTMIVNRADAFGLAQLYQIRGRVGRGQERAYAYLMIPAAGGISEDAKKRLEVIQRFVELGSGFSIASHDLEIRGGGDLLGPQQSGHIAAVGFDLYLELLEEAVREIKGQAEAPEGDHTSPNIKTPFAAFLAETFVPDVHQRLSLYRRFSAATREDQLAGMEEEIRDRFGPLPAEAQDLLWLIRIKILLKTYGIEALTAGSEKVSLQPGPRTPIEPARVIALVASRPKDFQLTPDSKIVVRVPTGSLRDLLFGLEKLLELLAPKARSDTL